MSHPDWLRVTMVAGLTVLHGCVVDHTSLAGNVACLATNDTYRYADSAGGIISIVDDETAFHVSGAGIRSADVDDLSFFVSRDAGGALVRNYGAINATLLGGSHWSGGGLGCASTAIPNGTALDVTCRNAYGDIHGYRFSPAVGLTELFAVVNNKKYGAKLVSSKGLLWNCRFAV